MQIAARTAAWAKSGGGVPTARDYVQDGLIAMWDGIENAGWGVHDPNATVWKDLIGDCDLTLKGSVVFGDSFLHVSSYGQYAFTENVNFQLLSDATFEVCATDLSVTNDSDMLFEMSYAAASAGGGYRLGFQDYGFSVQADSTWMKRINVGGVDNIRAGLFVLTSSTVSKTKSGFINCIEYMSGQQDIVNPVDNRTLYVSSIKSGHSAQWLGGKYRSFRIYNRILAQKEMNFNYDIDKVRFNLPDAT